MSHKFRFGADFCETISATSNLCFNRSNVQEITASDDQPNPTDPLALAQAAAASTDYTPQMHTEAYERLLHQISERDHSGYVVNPAILDLCEIAIYHAAYSKEGTINTLFV